MRHLEAPHRLRPCDKQLDEASTLCRSHRDGLGIGRDLSIHACELVSRHVVPCRVLLCCDANGMFSLVCPETDEALLHSTLSQSDKTTMHQ